MVSPLLAFHLAKFACQVAMPMKPAQPITFTSLSIQAGCDKHCANDSGRGGKSAGARSSEDCQAGSQADGQAYGPMTNRVRIIKHEAAKGPPDQS